MGGAEAYQPTCQEHHAISDVFLNPYLLIGNAGGFQEGVRKIMKDLRVDRKALCRMLNAALVTKQAGIFMYAAECCHCGHLHLDEGAWAKERH